MRVPSPSARLHRTLSRGIVAGVLVLAAGCGVDHHDIVASTVIPTPRTADVVGGRTGPEDTRSIRHVTVVVLDRLTSDPVAGAGSPQQETAGLRKTSGSHR